MAVDTNVAPATPGTDPQSIYEQSCQESQAKADQWMQDANLARAKGGKPEQIDARRRVARMFREMHLTGDAPPEREARLAEVDYSRPLVGTNSLAKEVSKPQGSGFLGLGKKQAFWVSTRYPPQSTEQPIYALAYYPLK